MGVRSAAFTKKLHEASRLQEAGGWGPATQNGVLYGRPRCSSHATYKVRLV